MKEMNVNNWKELALKRKVWNELAERAKTQKVVKPMQEEEENKKKKRRKNKKRKKSLDNSCRPSTQSATHLHSTALRHQINLTKYTESSSSSRHLQKYFQRFVFSVVRTVRRERKASQHAVEYC
jgi:hypothetical protein